MRGGLAMVKWTMVWLVQLSTELWLYLTVSGQKVRVKRVFCAVCGVSDHLGEAEIAHAFQEVGGVGVCGVV